MSAIDLLTKAIELDVNGRHREALHLYQNGISELLQQCKAEPEGDRKRHLQKKIEEYVLRAEQIKKLLPPIAGALVTKLLIMKGDTGYDYQRVFGKYLTDAVTEVQLEDPYLRDHHQIMNLLRFCELVVLQCRNVKVIEVTTTREPRSEAEQATAYEKMAESLMMRKRVKLRVNYSETMHDRQIILNNGYIIKIGRGLDYFQPPANKYSLGCLDYRLRECKECSVDILFCNENKRP